MLDISAVNIGSSNGLVPNRRRAIPWTYTDRIYWRLYRQTSNLRRTLLGNKVVDHSDVVGA